MFVSFRENPAIQFPLTIAKRAVEHALKASGMSYTILQASYFMEVWLTPALGFDAANHRDHQCARSDPSCDQHLASVGRVVRING